MSHGRSASTPAAGAVPGDRAPRPGGPGLRGAGPPPEMTYTLGRAMRYREDTPAEQARARAAVEAWREANPAGTCEELAGAIGGQVHPGYAGVRPRFFF